MAKYKPMVGSRKWNSIVAEGQKHLCDIRRPMTRVLAETRETEAKIKIVDILSLCQVISTAFVGDEILVEQTRALCTRLVLLRRMVREAEGKFICAEAILSCRQLQDVNKRLAIIEREDEREADVGA